MDDLYKLTKKELLKKCTDVGITKCNSKNKTELIELYNRKIGSKNDSVENIKKNVNLLECIDKLLKIYTIKELSNEFNLSIGTIKRWIELKNIPKNYEFDILKLLKIEIDYSKYTTKEKDQFFTPNNTASYCFKIFENILKKYKETIGDFKYIEPSAGNGSFLKVLPKNTIAIDIEPTQSSIIKYDYLEWKPNNIEERYVVFGNPPFGLRGHSALKFINHSYDFADYVCFILPQLFESDGKGVPRKRVLGYNLISSTKIESDFYEPNGNTLKINTIFQIWSKYNKNEMYDIKNISDENIKIYSMSDGGTIPTTRNKNMIGKCDIYIPSTCFGKENMKYYNSFDKLPGKKGYGVLFKTNKEKMLSKVKTIEWDKIAFLSTNSAYNLRSSQIYSILIN